MNFINIVKRLNLVEILLVCFSCLFFQDINFLLLGTLYKSGLQFCEANNFNVVTNDCFAFDENVFSSAPYSTTLLFSLINLCLVIMYVFFVVVNFIAR